VRFDYVVNVAHVLDGGGEGVAGARVVAYVFWRERAFAAVFEPESFISSNYSVNDRQYLALQIAGTLNG